MSLALVATIGVATILAALLFYLLLVINARGESEGDDEDSGT